ncbi:hypothetical protein [Arcticibacter sp. MXS-1]|uniref:hypothetical protein n=1 Tax=Arcticibacter sp. MXS-1 TaxID=3341726 RepID=UPI0035A87E0F
MASGLPAAAGSPLEYLSYNRLDKTYGSINSKAFSPCEIIAAIPARDEAGQGYGRQRYEKLREAGPQVLLSFFSDYPGRKMREKVEKLMGEGRLRLPWNRTSTDSGGEQRSQEDDWVDLKGKRTSFKED